METILKTIEFFGDRHRMAAKLGIRYDMISKYVCCKRFPSTKLALKIEEKTNGFIKAHDILTEKLKIKLERTKENEWFENNE